jgi:EAL domain-containing protein (putative c-di-GMP-specific phosphodiesterase class I)
VETEQQYNLLRSLGCDLAQGYFIARPMSADEFEAWLSSKKFIEMMQAV